MEGNSDLVFTQSKTSVHVILTLSQKRVSMRRRKLIVIEPATVNDLLLYYFFLWYAQVNPEQ